MPSLPGTGKACRTPNIWRWINQLTLPVVLDENFPFLDITNLSVRQRKILINGWKQGKKNKEKREREEKREKTRHPDKPEDMSNSTGLVLY